MSAQTRRVTDQLRSYWKSQCQGRPVPCESDINPVMLGTLWDYCFLISVGKDEKGDRHYHYEHLGRALFASLDYDAPNHEACEQLLAVDGHAMLKAIHQAADLEQAAEWHEEFQGGDALDYRVRGCLLPLLEPNGLRVSYLLGGLNWRAD